MSARRAYLIFRARATRSGEPTGWILVSDSGDLGSTYDDTHGREATAEDALRIARRIDPAVVSVVEDYADGGGWKVDVAS